MAYVYSGWLAFRLMVSGQLAAGRQAINDQPSTMKIGYIKNTEMSKSPFHTEKDKNKIPEE
jgi:hypothetical protein